MSTKKVQVAVVGDGGVGKTSMIVRYIYDGFKSSYDPTLINNYTATVRLQDRVVEIDIADTAGQEDYRALRDRYIADADVMLVVFSLAESLSLQAAENLLEEIQLIRDEEHFKFVLAGNKCDIDPSERQIVNADAEALAARYGGKFIETSARTNVGINEVFLEIARLAVEKNEPSRGTSGVGNCCSVA